VDLNAPAQRTSYGKPDLSGFWLPENATKHLLNLAADLKPEEVPLKPWALDLYNKRIDNNGKDHPGASCLPSGIPEKDNIPDGLKLVQTEDLTLLLHESRTIYRQIFTDGRPLPVDPQPNWNGYSTGRWMGDTLVVETNGLRDDLWLDMAGNPMTSAARVTERIRRPNLGSIEVEFTVDDPKAYTKPWTVLIKQALIVDTELVDEICLENEKSSQHLVGK
jgi:hypothetical protein